MREPAPRSGNATFEEFLEIEAHSDVRHEFVAGTLYAMAGASRRHNRISASIVLAIGPIARRQGCDIFASDMLTRASETAAYYPDISVVCDADDTNDRYMERPCLIIEIASPSTRDRDQREKLLQYRGVASLQTYLVVFQNERRVIHHWRTPSGGWARAEITGTELIELPCPGISLNLDAIYEGVTFDPA